MTTSPLALLPTALLISTNALAQTQNRPNIVLFLVDDMGWQETSVPFYKEKTLLNSRYRTPNMEQLASRGVKFTQAYASAISSPSRCSLLSGMNAARHKVTNWTFDYNVETDMNDPEMMPPTWNCNGIQPDTVTSAHNRHRTTLITPLPQLLKDAGYYTIHCGKAHFGARTTAGEDPRSFGFMVNIAGGANGGPASYLARKEFGSNRFHVYGLEQYYNTDSFLSAPCFEPCHRIKLSILEEGERLLFSDNHRGKVRSDCLIKIGFQLTLLLLGKFLEINDMDACRLKLSHQLLIDFFSFQLQALYFL